MGTYKYVFDEDEVRWFYEHGLPRLKPNEVYFLSCAARNKPLDDADREYYHIGRSEMFNKVVVHTDDYESFRRAIAKLECNEEAYRTKNGMRFPDSSLVLYVNITPTDAYRAMCEHMDELINVQRELTDSVLKKSEKGIESAYKNIRRSHSIGQSIFARCWGEDTWMDMDIDIEHPDMKSLGEAISAIVEDVIGRENFIMVHTAGGFHILLRKVSLRDIGVKFKTDPFNVIKNLIVDDIKVNRFHAEVKEIVKNENRMIPLPGTCQYGKHLVTIINKHHFS